MIPIWEIEKTFGENWSTDTEKLLNFGLLATQIGLWKSKRKTTAFTAREKLKWSKTLSMVISRRNMRKFPRHCIKYCKILHEPFENFEHIGEWFDLHLILFTQTMFSKWEEKSENPCGYDETKIKRERKKIP